MIAQFGIINDYNSYRQQLNKKYPEYQKATSSWRMYFRFFQTEQFQALIPCDHCYISYSVAKKDEASNTRANEILAFVVDDNGKIKSFSIAADDEFFAACNLYRDLLQYPNLNSLNRAGKYLWKKADGSYILTETSESLEGATKCLTAENFRDAKQELSTRLSEKLLTPLTEHISTKTTWRISPDGELNVIPFETLQFNGINSTKVEKFGRHWQRTRKSIGVLSGEYSKNADRNCGVGAKFKAAGQERRTLAVQTDFACGARLVHSRKTGFKRDCPQPD